MAEHGEHPAHLVLDTNIVVAGLLWNGPPRQVLELGMGETVALYSSAVLLDELAHTLAYQKFAALITQVTPARIARVSRDADDDQVLACALGAKADAIVSGDNDLRVLGDYRGIRILTAREALALITT